MKMKKVLNLFLVVTILISTIYIPLKAGAVTNSTFVTSTDNFETGATTTTPSTAWTLVASSPASLKYYMARGVWPTGGGNTLISARPNNSYGRVGDQTAKIAVNNTSNTLDYNDVVVVKTKVACTNVRGGGRVEVYDDNNVAIAAFIIGSSETLDGGANDPIKLSEDNYPVGINLYTGGSANIATDTSKITLLNFPNYALSPTTATTSTAKFFEVKMILDFRAKRLDAYIDGTAYATNVAFNPSASTGTNVGYVLLGTNLNNAGYDTTGMKPIYFDDYEVSITDTVSIVPSVTNVSIAGTPAINSALTANYTFVPKTGGALENTLATTYQWMSCDTQDGTYTNISGETSKSINLTSQVFNKYIKCEITPVDLNGLKGGAVKSSASGPVAIGDASVFITNQSMLPSIGGGYDITFTSYNNTSENINVPIMLAIYEENEYNSLVDFKYQYTTINANTFAKANTIHFDVDEIRNYKVNGYIWSDFETKIPYAPTLTLYAGLASSNTHTPVTLYADADFAGTSQELNVGSYINTQLTIGDNQLTSIRVQPGYKVTLYNDANYSGSTYVLTGDDNNLSSFDNYLSSIKIEVASPIDANCIQVSSFDSTTKASLLKTFAPRIYLATGEAYMPSSVEWAQPYLRRYLGSSSRYSYTTVEALTSPTQKLAFFSGNFASAQIYSFWTEKQYGNVDLSYWQYTPYNFGKVVFGSEVGNHVGDWEHVTVRLAKFTYNGLSYVKPVMVSMQAHSIVNLYTWSEVTKTSTTHTVAYSADGSHGMWKDSGSHTYESILSDECSAGTAWDTWNTINTYEYSTSSKSGTALGTSVWPTYFNTDYTNASGGAVYYWGNLTDGTQVFGQDVLSTGPKGPESTGVLTDSVLLK